MKIFVTGGGGFLGTWIIKELLKNPTYVVTNFSRHSYAHLEDLGVPTIRGDVTHYDQLDRALGLGFDAIFHVASIVGMWGKAETFDNINIQGTKNILELAQKHQVKRFVYTSSPSAVFGRGGHAGADETMDYPKEHLAHYPRTKAEAEKLVLAANSKNFYTVALRPHLIFGPGDMNLLPRVIDQARLGKLKIVGNGENQVDVIYVEEAARAHVMAFEALATNPAVAGQTYFLGQGPVKLWGFIKDVLDAAGAPRPESQVSKHLAYVAGSALERVWKLAGIFSPEPPLTKFVALNLSTDHWYSHAKAKRDFGWEPQISLQEGIKRSFAQAVQNRVIMEQFKKGVVNDLPKT